MNPYTDYQEQKPFQNLTVTHNRFGDTLTIALTVTDITKYPAAAHVSLAAAFAAMHEYHDHLAHNQIHQQFGHTIDEDDEGEYT